MNKSDLLKNTDFETYHRIEKSIDIILEERLKDFINQEQYRPRLDHSFFNMYNINGIDNQTFYTTKDGCYIMFDWKNYDGNHTKELTLPIEMFTLDDQEWTVFLLKLQIKITNEVQDVQKEMERLEGVIESKRLQSIEDKELSTLKELQEKYKDKK